MYAIFDEAKCVQHVGVTRAINPSLRLHLGRKPDEAHFVKAFHMERPNRCGGGGVFWGGYMSRRLQPHSLADTHAVVPGVGGVDKKFFLIFGWDFLILVWGCSTCAPRPTRGSVLDAIKAGGAVQCFTPA